MGGTSDRVRMVGVAVVVALACLACGSGVEPPGFETVPEASAGGGAGGDSPSGLGGSGASAGAAGTGVDGGSGGSGTAGTAGTAGAAGTAGTSAGASFPPITDLAAEGPFPINNGDAEGPNCTVYRPTNLGEGGLEHPIIIWANGTGGPTVAYSGAFRHWASHGFVVVAGNSINGQGAGEEVLGCLTHVCSAYQGNVECKAAASGHSQGGGGALMAGVDPRVVATAPLQPYILLGLGGFKTDSITNQTGPMLLLSGTLDIIAAPGPNQEPVFDDTNVPVVWANLKGGDHVTVAVNGLQTYREVMLAWFRLQLMGDEDWRPMFYDPCTLCSDSDWIVERRGMN